MLTKRIIPCLDIRDGRVVKGVNFVDIRDAGDPVEAAVRYNEAGADELVLLDINASYEKRGTMLDVVSRVAEQVFIPFTVGGGISDIDQIRALLRLGADKVSINARRAQPGFHHRKCAAVRQSVHRAGNGCKIARWRRLGRVRSRRAREHRAGRTGMGGRRRETRRG